MGDTPPIIYRPTFFDRYGEFMIQTGIVLVAAVLFVAVAALIYLYVRRQEAAARNEKAP